MCLIFFHTKTTEQFLINFSIIAYTSEAIGIGHNFIKILATYSRIARFLINLRGTLIRFSKIKVA